MAQLEWYDFSKKKTNKFKNKLKKIPSDTLALRVTKSRAEKLGSPCTTEIYR